MDDAVPHDQFTESPDALVDAGLLHQQSGRLFDAEQHYDRALAKQPDHVEALHLLGLVRHQTGRYSEAVELIQKAIALKSSPCPVLLTNVGAALQESKRLDEAEDCYRRAIQAKPDYMPAHENLCRLLPIRGKLQAAADAWVNLGNQLLDQGKPQEAYLRYRLALQFNIGKSRTPRRVPFHVSSRFDQGPQICIVLDQLGLGIVATRTVGRSGRQISAGNSIGSGVCGSSYVFGRDIIAIGPDD
jgi:protein O-GlcNAc transferase